MDNPTLQNIAKKVGESWPELALYLGLDVDECQAIEAAFPTVKEQAGQMLANWRQGFTGDNPVEYLARALIEMEQDEIATELGTSRKNKSVESKASVRDYNTLLWSLV